jgi:hypothetical protein
MNNIFKHTLSCLAATAASLIASTAMAHHSTTMFDHSTSVSIVGEVREVQWTNPHVAIFIYGVTKEGEPPALWLMEMTSPGNLVRAGGWTRTAIKKGDKVTVNFSPLRNGDKGGALKKITVADSGKVLTADIRAQERPNLQEEVTPAAK